MYIKVLLVLCLVGTAIAQYGFYENEEEDGYYKTQEVNDRQNHEEESVEYYDEPKYRFDVDDDYSNQDEKEPENRDGKVIKSYYSVHEPEKDTDKGFDVVEDRKGFASFQKAEPTTKDFFKQHQHPSYILRRTPGGSSSKGPSQGLPTTQEETGSHHVHNSHHGAALSFASYNHF